MVLILEAPIFKVGPDVDEDARICSWPFRVLTEAQREARDSFDPDESLAALDLIPNPPPVAGSSMSVRGGAGFRLEAGESASISPSLLREFAKIELHAKRCADDYFDALRVVLGNQARAELHGYVLEMNHRVSFASERVMRTIINQMKVARISFGCVVVLGGGRSQVVQCFANKAGLHPTPEHELEYLDRKIEAEGHARREAAVAEGRLVAEHSRDLGDWDDCSFC